MSNQNKINNQGLWLPNQCAALRPNSMYFRYDAHKNIFIGLTSSSVKQLDHWPAIVRKNIVLKYDSVQITKRKMEAIFLKFLAYKPQIFERCKHFINYIQNAITKLTNVVTTIVHSSQNIYNYFDFALENIDSIKLSLLDILDLLITLLDTNPLTSMRVIQILIKVYRTLSGVKGIVDSYEPQIPDSTILLAAAAFMPSSLLDILRKINLLSTVKVWDDVSYFYAIYEYIMTFFSSLIEFLPKNLMDPVRKIISLLPSITKFKTLSNLKTLVGKYDRDKRVVLDSNYRSLVESARKQYKDDNSFLDWERKSPSLHALIIRFERIYKIVLSYGNSARVEPICIVIEGPPGCGKSKTMNVLLDVLDHLRAYGHSVKSIKDTKDYYDHYDNEDILYMDDVGQQGVSQWRTIINMVSPVKLPLDCAVAENKDTKFFSSKLIMLTTNNISNLHALTKDDCISDITALWRRTIVLKMDGKNPFACTINHFDPFSQSWKPGTYQFKNKPEKVSSESMEEYIGGLTGLINALLNFQEKTLEDKRLTQSQKQIIEQHAQEMQRNLEAQILFETDWIDSIFIMIQEFLESLTAEDFLLYGLFALFLGTCWFLYTSQPVNHRSQINKKMIKLKKDNPDNCDCPSNVQYVSENVYHCDIQLGNDRKVETVCLVSGHNIITVAHMLTGESAYITIYKDREANYRLFDHTMIYKKYISVVDDVIVWQFSSNIATPFKSIKNHIKLSTNIHNPYFLYPGVILNLEKHLAPKEYGGAYRDDDSDFCNVLYESDLYYYIQAGGICGSVVISNNGIAGMHVAGSSLTNVGVTKVWSDNVKKKILEFINDDKNFLNIPIAPKILTDFSGIKLHADPNIHTNKETDIVPSPLYNVFPISRVPADLKSNGDHTIKDIAKKSFKPLKTIKNEELNFAKSVITSIMKEYGDLDMKEVIKGNEYLARLNKDSSNGYGLDPEKTTYIDYDEGRIKPEYAQEFTDWKNRVISQPNPEDLVWTECMKDELRSKEKTTPRTFRIATLWNQLSSKQIFGYFVQHIVQTRAFHKIMIGCNPYTDWEYIYETLKGLNVFAGDIGSFDGGMLAQVQSLISEILLSFYKGPQKDLAEHLLFSTSSLLIGINDDLYLTNHSMPSGCFLTAIFNSLVNLSYGAMWYYRNVKDERTVQGFWKNVTLYVYGDDSVVGVSEKYPQLNAITMREFFESIGLTYTDSSKKPVVTPYESLSDITFLKRSFRFHHAIGRVMCPLDLKTLYSTMSFISGSKDQSTVIRDKVRMFQREIYLHTERYQIDLEILRNSCEKHGIPFDFLPEHYLLYLYKYDAASLASYDKYLLN